MSDEEIVDTPFYRPPEESPEMEYLLARRKALGGFLPRREVTAEPLKPPPLSDFGEFLKGSGRMEVSTTMAFVRMLGA